MFSPLYEYEEYKRLNLSEDWPNEPTSGQLAMDVVDFLAEWNPTRGDLNLSDIGEIITSIWTFDEVDEEKYPDWWEDHEGMPNSCRAWLLWLEDEQWAVLVGARYNTDDQQGARGPALYVSPSVFKAIELATELSIEELNRFFQVVHLLYPHVPYAYPDGFAPQPDPPWYYLHRQWDDSEND